MAGALESLTDVSILVFDQDERIRAVTGTAHSEQGFLPEQMIGRPAADALAPNAWAALRPSFAAALSGETRTRDFGGRDGTSTFEATTSPVLSGAVVVGGMVVTRDVTERRRDQDLITELREAFEMTFDHSPICQALLSPEGEWLRVNGALRDLLGRDEASLAGRPAREITHPDDVEAEDALLHEVRQGRRNRYTVQKRLLREDGRGVPVQLRMSAVRTGTGEVRGLIAQILDADVLARGAEAPPPLGH
jgi:PAS domain S-box-containing protein